MKLVPEIPDVIVGGGCPAGLSAALLFGRCRWSVAVFDEVRTRNEMSRCVNCRRSDHFATVVFMKGSRSLGHRVREAPTPGRYFFHARLVLVDCRLPVPIWRFTTG